MAQFSRISVHKDGLKQHISMLLYPPYEVVSRLFEGLHSVLGSQPSTGPNGHPKICVDTPEHAWTAYGHPVF